MRYTALELNAYLTHLTLTGYEDGEYIFVGEPREWSLAESHIDCGGVLCDMCGKVNCPCDYDFDNSRD